MKLTAEEAIDAGVAEVMADAVHEIHNLGLARPKLPRTADGDPLNPKLPRDLAGAPSQHLGKLLGHLTSCANYAAYVASAEDLRRVVAEHELEYITARVRLEKTGTNAAKNDKTAADPRVKDANAAYFAAFAKAKMTAVLLANYERQISAVSREITRRTNELERRVI
jgi:hypothetical protein